ncbi:MAG: bifunctional pyr operon transcriptional regulator/uracil phosphoribosyltransferase PyrR [Deferribacterota bacterium]|nr:bifunctional pyr operon transcriptional regulator/uracil phosphoribosyltransferase PyrR [Deferribacterota bacterium]
MSEVELLNKYELNNIIEKIVKYVINTINKENNIDSVAVIGIKTRGAILADRIKNITKRDFNIELDTGYIDITLYRDDFTELTKLPVMHQTEIDFDVDGRKIILVDDVIFTGRTVRSALDAIIDLGRPKKIYLAVIVDKNHRELPIQPDFTGKFFKTDINDIINVKLEEIDSIDSVTLSKR